MSRTKTTREPTPLRNLDDPEGIRPAFRIERMHGLGRAEGSLLPRVVTESPRLAPPLTDPIRPGEVRHAALRLVSGALIVIQVWTDEELDAMKGAGQAPLEGLSILPGIGWFRAWQPELGEYDPEVRGIVAEQEAAIATHWSVRSLDDGRRLDQPRPGKRARREPR